MKKIDPLNLSQNFQILQEKILPIKYKDKLEKNFCNHTAWYKKTFYKSVERKEKKQKEGKKGGKEGKKKSKGQT